MPLCLPMRTCMLRVAVGAFVAQGPTPGHVYSSLLDPKQQQQKQQQLLLPGQEQDGEQQLLQKQHQKAGLDLFG